MTKEGILKYAEQNKFVLFCGIELHEDTDGNYYTTIDVKEHHHNPYGITHGGLLYTMADTTAGNNARRFADKTVTLNSTFNFFRNTSSGVLTARPQITKKGKTITVIRVSISDEKGNLLAEGDFTYFNIEE